MDWDINDDRSFTSTQYVFQSKNSVARTHSWNEIFVHYGVIAMRCSESISKIVESVNGMLFAYNAIDIFFVGDIDIVEPSAILPLIGPSMLCMSRAHECELLLRPTETNMKKTEERITSQLCATQKRRTCVPCLCVFVWFRWSLAKKSFVIVLSKHQRRQLLTNRKTDRIIHYRRQLVPHIDCAFVPHSISFYFIFFSYWPLFHRKFILYLPMWVIVCAFLSACLGLCKRISVWLDVCVRVLRTRRRETNAIDSTHRRRQQNAEREKSAPCDGAREIFNHYYYMQ